MTAVPQENEVVEGHLPGGMSEGSVTFTRAGAQARACAVVPSPEEVPDEVPSFLSRVHMPAWVLSGQAWASALTEKPGTLIHSQPPTFREAHIRHRESADHFSSWFMRNQRMGFGWFHLTVIKPTLNYVEWATESELRFVIHVVLAALIFIGLLAGGYIHL